MTVRHPSVGADRTAPERPDDDRRAEADVTLARGLAGYVRAVAGLLHVGSEATAYEVSDTATAYLALNAQSSGHPGRDLMLVWTERQGWALAVETAPGEPPVMLASLCSDLVPEPEEVTRFVNNVLAGRSRARCSPPRSAVGRRGVGMRLTRYAQARS